MLGNIMYEQYVFQPQTRPLELQHAIQVVRPFLRGRQPYLHEVVQQAAITRAMGRVALHPQTIAAQTLREDQDSSRLCSVLTSDWADAALTVLAWELPMPGMRLLIEVLPLAAKALCAERQRNNAKALGLGALVAGVLLVVGAVTKPKQQPAV